MNDSTQSAPTDDGGVLRVVPDLHIAEIIWRRHDHYELGERLLAQRHAGEITQQEYMDLLDQHGDEVPLFPMDYSLGPCPDWCTAGHSTGAGTFERTEGTQSHAHKIATIGGMSVEVGLMDDLDEGTRSPVKIHVWGSDKDELDPADARLLADALVRAADLVDGHWSPR